jgi:hypothetical protein
MVRRSRIEHPSCPMFHRLTSDPSRANVLCLVTAHEHYSRRVADSTSHRSTLFCGPKKFTNSRLFTNRPLKERRSFL